MNNTIIYSDQIADRVIRELREERPNDERIDSQRYAERIQVLHLESLIGFEAYFGIVDAVNYNDKTDKYVIKHQYGTAKCADDVAAFMMANAFNRRQRPTVHANIVNGTVVSVALRYLNEKD